MRVLVCGDRNWNDQHAMHKILDTIREVHSAVALTIIEGGATGADTMAGMWAYHADINRKQFQADWTTYGKKAGPLRNQQMIDEGKPDLIIAFHDNIEASKGTKDMMKRAHRAQVPVFLFSHKIPVPAISP